MSNTTVFKVYKDAEIAWLWKDPEKPASYLHSAEAAVHRNGLVEIKSSGDLIVTHIGNVAIKVVDWRDRESIVAKQILEALYITWQTYEAAETPAEERDYSFGPLALVVNTLRGAAACLTVHRIASIVRKKFGLRTERRKTIDRRSQIVWDAERIGELWRRYGLGSDEARGKLMAAYRAKRG